MPTGTSAAISIATTSFVRRRSRSSGIGAFKMRGSLADSMRIRRDGLVCTSSAPAPTTGGPGVASAEIGGRWAVAHRVSTRRISWYTGDPVGDTITLSSSARPATTSSPCAIDWMPARMISE